MELNNEITIGVEAPATIRNFKDTVFRMLFSDKENLLSLYNALNGTAYENPSLLEIVTLVNAIYMSMKNDLAFIINAELNLYEHQSTYNPNLPLRDLFYVSSEYQKMKTSGTIYTSRLLKIPAPNFIAFYNGTEDRPEKFQHKLSDAYIALKGEPNLELIVTVYNVNYGKNKALMEQCRILEEYSIYVSKVREHAKNHELKDAVEIAVAECIRENILKEFLIKNRSEVVMLSIFEYNKEEEEKKIRKAEYEMGYDEGKAKGEAEGRAEGRAEGEAAGLSKGQALGLIKGLLKIINKKWSVPENVISRIKSETDDAILEQWTDLALSAPDLDSFIAGIS